MNEVNYRWKVLTILFASWAISLSVLSLTVVKQSARVCGPDRCQSATQACEYVRIHAAEVLPKDREIATEFVEAACGY